MSERSPPGHLRPYCAAGECQPDAVPLPATGPDVGDAMPDDCNRQVRRRRQYLHHDR
ncbi:hypothetical protein CH48_4155 (plasmid) [Yersinia enterocolitica]|nr:hypothetical protein CH48_4155 [Yersinia enterocolitica]KGA75151.1 hypothetical protein DJ61_3899 [Yersinia enterocolitica]